MVAAPLFIALAAAVVGAAGTVASGVMASKAAKAQAAQHKQDAEVAREQSRLAERGSRLRSKRLLARQRSLFAAGGVQLAGSALLVLEETASEAELEALAIRFGGAAEASRREQQGRLARFRGKAARTASFFKAGSSLLRGGAAFGEAGGFGSTGGAPTETPPIPRRRPT